MKLLKIGVVEDELVIARTILSTLDERDIRIADRP